MAESIKVLQIKTPKNEVFCCLLEGVKMQLAVGNYELGKDFPTEKGEALAKNFPQNCVILTGDVVPEEPEKIVKETLEETKEVVYNSSENKEVEKEEVRPVVKAEKKTGRPKKK